MGVIKMVSILEGKVFGEKQTGIEYQDRVGAYAVMFDENNRAAAVRTKTGYFLLGGGIENGETDQECIIRECLEEAGCLVEVGQHICQASKYHWSDTLAYFMHNIGHFYLTRLVHLDSIPIEEDHQLVWLNRKECAQKLFLDHQAWVVEQVYQLEETK